MRILHVIGDLNVGGAQMMLLKLAGEELRHGFSPAIVSLQDEGTLGPLLRGLGVPLHTLGMGPGLPLPQPSALLRLARELRRGAVDVVHGWMYHGNVAALAAAAMAGPATRVIWGIRQSLTALREEKRLSALLIRLSARLSSRPDRILCNSRASLQQHLALGFDGRRASVIPNGFDCTRFRPDPAARQRLRRELRIPEEAIAIGLIARFHPMKDHATFLQAAAALSRRDPAVHFVIAGPGVAAVQPALQALGGGTGHLDRCHILGERHDVPALTASLDIACSSSVSREGFSNALGEAMACALPCVATDVGDSAYVLGGSGLIIPPGDPAALLAAWQRLIAAGSAARHRLGAAARDRISEHFALPQIAGRYFELYRGLGGREAG